MSRQKMLKTKLYSYSTLVVINLFVLRQPFLVIEDFGGTPSYNLQVNICQVRKLELFRAPCLRTTTQQHFLSSKSVNHELKHFFKSQLLLKGKLDTKVVT